MREVRTERSICHLYFRSLVQLVDEALCHVEQCTHTFSGPVLQSHEEGVTCTVTGNHRRSEDEDLRILYMGGTRVYHVGYGSVAVLFSRTFVPRLELDDHHTVGCSRTAEAEAGYLVVDEYLRQVLDAVGHFVKGFCSLMKCTSRDGIHADEERTHILVRHERSLAGAHQVHQNADSCYQDQAGSPFVPDEECHAVLVFLRHALECGIERYPETCRELFRFFARFHFLVRFEDEGAHRRRECQGVDSGKTHCHCHRQTELRIEYSGGTAHERYRDEHCHEDECGSHDGGRNAVYGVHRSLVR